MDGLAIITSSLDALRMLAKKDIIFFDDLDPKFQPDLQKFIVGETLAMQNGRIVVGRNLYKKWLEKINKRGFDYEIDFKK